MSMCLHTLWLLTSSQQCGDYRHVVGTGRCIDIDRCRSGKIVENIHFSDMEKFNQNKMLIFYVSTIGT